MTRHWLYLAVFAALLPIEVPPPDASAEAAAPGDGAKANVKFKDRQGEAVGDATLTEVVHGVLVRAELKNLPLGSHAFHIHAVGKCEPPSFLRPVDISIRPTASTDTTRQTGHMRRPRARRRKRSLAMASMSARLAAWVLSVGR
jgi:Cu/Zn superoxide dismutase